MTRIDCFFLEPTGRVHVYLRRYGTMPAAPCQLCDAQVRLTTIPADDADDNSDLWPHDDPRWPRHCAGCGRPFGFRDRYQLSHEHVYRRQDTGVEMGLAEAPPGAMWDSYWLRGVGPERGNLIVRLPCGDSWNVDGHSKSGAAWKRTGTLPKITVRPPIRTKAGYHGHLTDGQLVSCPDSKI